MSRGYQNDNNRPVRNDYIYDESEYSGYEPVYEEDRRAYNAYDNYDRSGSGRRYEDEYDDTYDAYAAGSTLRRSRAESAYRSAYPGTNAYIDPEESAKAKKSNIIKIAAFCFVALIMVIVNVAVTFAFDMLGNVNTITQEQVDDFRVQGDELVELDKEFAESSTDTVSETDLDLPTDYIMSTDDVSLILLVGSDSRLGVSKAARSDSMMIVAIDRKHKKIKMASIMRDLFAIIPDYKNDRFNTAFYYDSRYGNLDLKITFRTIEKNLGIKMEDYVVVDFSGFRKIVDLLGGVSIEVNKKEAQYMCSHKDYGRFPRYKEGAGTYLMTGAEALNYCRMRKVGNGDFERTERQRKVISQIVSQLKGSDASTLYNIAMACMDSVVTNIPEQEIIGYAMEAVDILGYDIVQMQIPIEGSYVYSNVYKGTTRMSVLWPNYNWNAKQLRKFIFDDDMTYISGKKATNVTIPFLPAGTITSLEPESPTDITSDTTSTETTSTESTTSSTESTSSTTSGSSSSSSSSESTTTSSEATESTTTTTTTTTTTAATTTTTTTAAPAPDPEPGTEG